MSVPSLEPVPSRLTLKPARVASLFSKPAPLHPPSPFRLGHVRSQSTWSCQTSTTELDHHRLSDKSRDLESIITDIIRGLQVKYVQPVRQIDKRALFRLIEYLKEEKGAMLFV